MDVHTRSIRGWHLSRSIRTTKEGEVDLLEYRNFAEAREQIGRFLDEVYLKKRIHSLPDYLTPSECEIE